MSIELVGAGNIEHSERHDLESFFYLLLCICTKYESPGKRNIWDCCTPFGTRGEESVLYRTSRVKRMLNCLEEKRTEVFKNVHLYFTPLIPLLANFCNAVFQQEEEEHGPIRTCGTHAKVLCVLNEAFDELPDQGVIPGCPENETPDAEILPTTN
jgi:hypothetical protein